MTGVLAVLAFAAMFVMFAVLPRRLLGRRDDE